MNNRTLLFLLFSCIAFVSSAQITNYAIPPYSTGFENGTLDANWATQTSSPTGRIRVHLGGILAWGGDTAVAHTGNYFLGLDDSTGGAFHTQEAWMGLNLAGAPNVDLDFWWAEWNEETHVQDGVFFSDNGGMSFVKVLDLNGPSYPDLQWNFFSLDVDSIAQANGLSLTATFVVKFQQHDNFFFAGGNDGFLIDDISVTGGNPACINDVTPPIAICQNVTLALPAAGVDTLAGSAVDNGSTDNCAISTFSLNQEVFTCADLGMNTVSLTTTDFSGNTANCTATVMVTDPNGATARPVNLGADTAICPGTTLNLDAGFPGSNYSWTPSGNTQTLAAGAGTYTVLVTDSLGCTGNDTITITDRVVPSSNPTPVNSPAVICTGQSITIQADSGFASYLWISGTPGPTITVSNGGTLTVTVTDSVGCQRTDSLVITQVNAAPPSAAITPTGPVYTCVGTPATLSAQTGLNSYLWSENSTTPDITVGPGFYTVTVTGPNGCQNISATPTEVRDTFATVPTLTVTTDSICASASGAQSWSWLLNGSPLGLTTPCIAPTVNGNYTCVVTDSFGCEASDSTSFLVNLEAPTSAWNVQIAPNPFAEGTKISFIPDQSDQVQVEVYSLDGRMIAQLFQEEVLSGVQYTAEFRPAPHLANGTYLYRIRTASGQQFSGRLWLNR